MTRNGFSLPLDPYQISSWVLVILNISLEIALKVLISFGLAEEIFFWLAECTNLILVILAYLVTQSCPNVSPYIERGNPEVVQYFCMVCSRYVFQSAKHCSKCDRCVSDFDHHCRWLNNCICKHNYVLFLFTVSSLELNCVFVLCFYFSLLKHEDFFVFIMVGISINLLVLLASTWLLVMHAYFCAKGITTYQFLTDRKKRKVKHEELPQEEEERDIEQNEKIEIKSQEILVTDEAEDNRLIKTEEIGIL